MKSLNKKNSALLEAHFCMCGSVNLLLDMKKLAEGTDHSHTLISVAEVIGELRQRYLKEQGLTAQKSPLKLVHANK